MRASQHPGIWRVKLTPEAEAWFGGLDRRDAHRITAAFDMLEQRGPTLGRPVVDSIQRSRHHNMKELRSVGGHLRALFAFDPRQRAIVLVAGDKSGDSKGWYKRNIPLADKLYDRHLRSLGKEEMWATRARTGERSAGRGR